MPLSPIDTSSERSSAGAPDSGHAPASATVHDWTCPFCPLLCDDLTVRREADGTLTAPDTGCDRLARALASFGAADAACPPRIDGQPVGFDEAIARAAAILATARRALFGGLATDVAGARTVYALAAACGATLDHLHGETLSAVTRVIQDRGAFFTTLSEIRARADLLIFFGCRPSERYPRFFARALRATGGGDDGHERGNRDKGSESDAPDFERELVFVGGEADPSTNDLPRATTRTMLPNLDPFDIVALWSALAEGRRPAALGVLRGELAAAVDALAALTARIAEAQYAVIVYEPAALPNGRGQPAALLIEGLHRIVKAINLKTRAAAFALGGDDGATTVNQAVTWLSGLPLPLRVPSVLRGDGTAQLEHDAGRYRTARLIDESGARYGTDALLWIAALGPSALPRALAADVPAIVIGHPALSEAAATRSAPTVFIPAATPGVDTEGHLFRLDATVVAPLTALRANTLPSVAQIATSLTEQLSGLARQPGQAAGRAAGQRADEHADRGTADGGAGGGTDRADGAGEPKP
jgi:formylmethanofuran dehydrogenase subunit B